MKTMTELRAMLSEEIDTFRAKKTTAAQLNAITNAAGRILHSIKLELEYARMQGRTPKVLTIDAE